MREQGCRPVSRDAGQLCEISEPADACSGIPCAGYHVRPGFSTAKLSCLLDAFDLWASYTDLSNFQFLNEGDSCNHKYTQDLNSGAYVMRHHSCETAAGKALEDKVPPMCGNAPGLGTARPSYGRFRSSTSSTPLLAY